MNIQLWPSAGEGEPGIETYYFEVPIGASGAVGAIVRQRGLANPIGVARSSAGVYVFSLLDGVNTIVDWSVDIITATPISGGQGMWPRVTARTQTSITWTIMNANGAAAADPSSGDIIIGSITVKNTNA